MSHNSVINHSIIINNSILHQKSIAYHNISKQTDVFSKIYSLLTQTVKNSKIDAKQ